MRGGEVVLDHLLQIFPSADLFTLFYSKGKLNARIENRKIFTAFTDRLPFKKKYYRSYLPFFPMAIESFDLRGYDLVFSSSHCVAKGIIPPPLAPHISYIHSPMRYVWDMYYEYFPQSSGLKPFLLHYFSHKLRQWDSVSSNRVDEFIANSHFVAQRIKKYYRRDSKVIHPPCLSASHKIPKTEKKDFYLVVSAFAPYKRIDLVIEAFRKNGRKLVLVGGGQREAKLVRNLPSNIEWKQGISREEVQNLYKSAKGFVFPGLEDFGITPVEAQSYGTPVIAYGKGGALETVIPRKTGVFFPNQTVESLLAAIEESESLSFKKEDFARSIARFTNEKFINEIRTIVDRHK